MRRSTPTAIWTFQLRLHIFPSMAMHEAIVDYVPFRPKQPESGLSRHGLRLVHSEFIVSLPERRDSDEAITLPSIVQRFLYLLAVS